MYHIETEKYIIRRICESDCIDVKFLLLENKYLSMIWHSGLFSEEYLEQLIRRLYLNNETTYSVIERQTNQFCGYVEIQPEREDGVLTIRLKEDADLYEIIELFWKNIKFIRSKNKRI